MGGISAHQCFQTTQNKIGQGHIVEPETLRVGAPNQLWTWDGFAVRCWLDQVGDQSFGRRDRRHRSAMQNRSLGFRPFGATWTAEIYTKKRAENRSYKL